ncbi:MAG: DUF2339 domain-containing protein [Verrucomicrobiota bacterium]
MSAKDRIDDFERRLRRLETELAELRRIAATATAIVEQEAAPAEVVGPQSARPPEVSPDVEPESTREETPLAERWYERSWEPGGDLRLSDLLGARALAWTGGIVRLFGIVLFFALAVDRGWIGEGARVVLGACASAIVFGGGLLLRRWFGETHAAVAAVGAGIGGAYATLLAAGPYYDLIPDWAALILAGCVAAVACALSLAWSSELIAGIGVVGALAVPVPIAWGDGVTTTGTGFVALMFAASAVVSVYKRWQMLPSASTILVVPQVLALAAEHWLRLHMPSSRSGAVTVRAPSRWHLRVDRSLAPVDANRAGRASLWHRLARRPRRGVRGVPRGAAASRELGLAPGGRHCAACLRTAGVHVLGLLLPSRQLQLAAALGLGLALVKNLGYDLPRLDAPQRSWTMIVVGAALLAAGFLFLRFAVPDPRSGKLASGVASGTVVYAIAAPIDLLSGDWHGISRTGPALVVPAALYGGLCALVLPLGRLRDFATVLWAEALLVPSASRRSCSTERGP